MGSQKEISGSELKLDVRNLGNSAYPEQYIKSIRVRTIADGGFYGPVIIPEGENFVTKTTQPADFPYLLRLMNWGFKTFPSQVNETAAKMDHLAARLIHQTIPPVTQGQFYAPDSFGYTQIEGRGFSQLIEMIRGRPARFDLDEYPYFKAAQKTLKETGFRLGFEQAAQVHEDNPFGLANVWWDLDRSCFVWLDTLPAMPHKPVMGFIPFKFHEDTRRRFYEEDRGTYTFNTIHTDLTRAEVERNRSSFEGRSYREIMDNLELYDGLQIEFAKEYHPLVQTAEVIKTAARLAKGSLIAGISLPFVKTAEGIINTFKLATSSKAQADMALSGIREARSHNLVSEKEAAQAEAYFEGYTIWKRGNLVATVPAAVFLGIGYASWVVAGLYGVEMHQAGQLFENGMSFDSATDLAKLYGVRWLLSNLPKGGVAEAATRITGHNFRPAFITSLIPGVGDYLSPIGHLAGSAANTDPQILHFLVRKACGDISGAIPSGGMGSEFEAMIYQSIGKKVEGLLKQSN